jgi:hypothetical protein
MEKWKKDVILSMIIWIVIFSAIEWVWTFFTGETWGSSFKRDLIYLALAVVFTMVTILNEDYEESDYADLNSSNNNNKKRSLRSLLLSGVKESLTFDFFVHDYDSGWKDGPHFIHHELSKEQRTSVDQIFTSGGEDHKVLQILQTIFTDDKVLLEQFSKKARKIAYRKKKWNDVNIEINNLSVGGKTFTSEQNNTVNDVKFFIPADEDRIYYDM